MSRTYQSYLLIFLISFVVSLALVPLSRLLAFRFRVLDVPDLRKRHGKAMPYLGGLAIILSFHLIVMGSLAGLFFLRKSGFLIGLFPWIPEEMPRLLLVMSKLIALLVGSVGMFSLGLIDDILGAKFDFRLKFIFQVVIAIAMTLFGIRTDFLQNDFLDNLFTVLWIVGITNSFNLLDNMDGLSSGVAYICTIFLFVIAAKQEQFFIGLAYVSLAGALLGFLYFNFPPAKIFLGDAGALYIGFLVATLTVLQSFGTDQNYGIFPILMPVCILGLPIFDTARVMIIRYHEKRPLFQGDRRHLSHRLVEMGLSERQTVFVLYMLTACLGVASLALETSTTFLSGVLIFQALCFVLIISMLLAWTKR